MDVKENITQEAVERKCVKRAAPDHKKHFFFNQSRWNYCLTQQSWIQHKLPISSVVSKSRNELFSPNANVNQELKEDLFWRASLDISSYTKALSYFFCFNTFSIMKRYKQIACFSEGNALNLHIRDDVRQHTPPVK